MPGGLHSKGLSKSCLAGRHCRLTAFITRQLKSLLRSFRQWLYRKMALLRRSACRAKSLCGLFSGIRSFYSAQMKVAALSLAPLYLPVSLLFNRLLASPPFHLFSLSVVLFALACRRFGESYFHYCCSTEATSYCHIKSIHIVR